MLYWLTSIMDMKHGIYSQAAWQPVHFLLAVYGLCIWIRRRRSSNMKKMEKP